MRILKARRLLTQDAFCDVAVEEGVGYIQLVRWPVLGRDEREDDTDRGGFDDRGEGFAEVDPRPLMKPAHHPSSFVAFQTVIRYVCLNTHLLMMTRVPCGRGTRRQVHLACRASYLSYIAAIQLGSLKQL